MKRFPLFSLLFLLGAGARAQSFPYAETFGAYAPGSTGAPVWSALAGQWRVTGGALAGPVAARFNARPARQYVAEMTVDATGATAGQAAEAGFVFNMGREQDLCAADAVRVRWQADGTAAVAAGPGAACPDAKPAETAIPEPGPDRKTARLKLVVDADTGRYALFLNDTALVRAAAAEYGAGLLAITAGAGTRVSGVTLRAIRPEETRAVAVTTLLNDPRDIAAGDNGMILVLHRGSPAVLGLTIDGEVKISFGRRQTGGIPDPVALARGRFGRVVVLNRFPGEVVMYERNGGIRNRFGTGRLQAPADLAVLNDGTMYVADPGGRQVCVFREDGALLGVVNTFNGIAGAPVRIAADHLENVLVTLDGGPTLLMRPSADRSQLAYSGTAGAPVADAAAHEGRTVALRGGAVAAWPESEGGSAFRADAAGGLDPNGRLAIVDGAAWALDRRGARLVAIPASFTDATPETSFQNIGQTVALVRWTSAQPAQKSHVRVLRGQTWDTVTATAAQPTTQHQVVLERLRPGRSYRYTVAPLVRTIPPVDWSREYMFQTAPEGRATAQSPAEGQAMAGSAPESRLTGGAAP